MRNSIYMLYPNLTNKLSRHKLLVRLIYDIRLLKMSTKKTIITGVAVILIAGLIISLVHYILPEGWTTLFHYSKDKVSVSRWIWWLSIMANILFTLGVIIFLIAMYRSKSDESIKYTHDTFLDISWRWWYGYGDVQELRSFCPNCDIQIEARPKTSSSFGHPSNDSIVYQCDDCEWDGKEFDFSKSEIEKRVKLKIQQKLRGTSRKRYI